MPKLQITMEVEFSELPDDVREELADGLNFRADTDETLNGDLDTVPRVSEMTPDEITQAVSEFFHGLSDYETQAEAWAGSEVYGYVSEIRVMEIKEL